MTGAVLRYLLLLPANLFFVLLAYALSPLLALISMATGPVLPGILQWFSTLDDTLDGGQHQHPEIYPPATGFKLWWQRVRWICRNPSHGWQSRLLGFPTAGHEVLSEGAHFTKMRDAKGRIYFSVRFYSPKIWFGWNVRAYDGVNHGYEFQLNPFKKA
jgi:hypothetical protein